jgi:ABC-3C protein
MAGHTNQDATWHPSVDAIAGVFFSYRLQLRFFEARGSAFQQLFTSIMQRAFGEDFWATGTYGNVGDMKCDGYLKTERRVFGLYAPNDFLKRLDQAKRKVSGDHAGAIKHWKPHMDVWTLVHNGRDGLPAPMQQVLLELEANEPHTQVSQWDLAEIQGVLQMLPIGQLTDLFGPAPTKRDFARAATQEDLRRVISDMAAVLEHESEALPPQSSVDIRQVPPQKLEYNKLSRCVRQWLSVGRPHASKVQRFFERHTDVGLADRVVRAFRRRYEELRSDSGRSPDEVFSALDEYAGGDDPDPRVKLTAVAVVAYLFEACHIFERPPDPAGTPSDVASNENPLPGAISPRAGSRRPEASE